MESPAMYLYSLQPQRSSPATPITPGSAAGKTSICPGNDLAQPFAMVSIRSPEAQVNDVHLLCYCPAERGFEDGHGSGEVIRENLDRIKFDPRRLGSEDTGQG